MVGRPHALLLTFLLPEYITSRNDGNVRARLFLLLAIVSMFAISTFFVAAYASIFFQGIKMVLIDNVDEPIINRIIAYQDRFTVLSLSQQVMFFAEVVIGDFVVVWRAWVLWAEKRRVVYVSVALFLCSVASVVGFLGCLVHFGWPLDMPPTCYALSISNYALSIATNIFATGAIAYKVWIHRRVLRAYLHTGGQPVVQKSLVLILESGIFYSFLWLLQLFAAIPSTDGLFQQILLSLSVQLVGIYPTLVVILVYLQKSLWDPSGGSCHLSSSSEILISGGTAIQLERVPFHLRS
ncbi:hypothetical protein L218DRAFT_185414 [Marasmius fiardii PR-910]|nr:hypothetical protein L218DRAFT_185414 [Marasmius fiardii PR-910]